MKKTSLVLFVFLFLLVLFFIPTKVKATDDELVTVQFVDNNLYTTIKEQLGSKIYSSKESTKSMVITQQNILSVKSLTLNEKNIVDLTGLEKFTNLEILHLSSNNINSVLPIRKLVNLKILDLSNNEISNVYYLKYLTQLLSLNLNDNKISNVTYLSYITSLRILNLNKNDIKDISSFSKLSNLIILKLDENHIGDISSLYELENLKTLSLKKQKFNNVLPINTLGNIKTNVALPKFFLETKQKNSLTYTDLDFAVFGASIGNDSTYIVLQNTMAGQKVATVRIVGGIADGSLMVLKYNCVLVSLTDFVSNPNKLYTSDGGTITFNVNASGETSTDNVSIHILKNNVDVTNKFNITKQDLKNTSAKMYLDIPNNTEAGNYLICVKYNNKIATKQSFTVYENIEVSGIKLNTYKLTLPLNVQIQLTAVVTPSNATNKNVTWVSSNPFIVSVDSKGNIVTKNYGTATITAISGNENASCIVTVQKPEPEAIPVQSISINKTNLTLVEGKSETLIATILPADATNKNFTWLSTNKNVATVDSTGKVATKSAGKAKIIVNAEDNKLGTKQAICEITVIKDKVTSSLYSIENNVISNIKPNCSLCELLPDLQIPLSYKVYDAKGNEVLYDTIACTGMYIELENGIRYPLAVAGDVSGDGRITASDIFIFKKHITGVQTLTGAYKKAGDLNNNGSTTLTDLVKMKKVVVRLENI